MLKYFRVIFLNLFRIIFAYFGWILRYSRHPEKYPLELRFKKVKKLVTDVINDFHINYETINVEYIQRKDDENPRLIVCNHISDLDPLIFIILMDKPVSFVAKKEIAKMPVVGRIVKVLDGFFMDREDLKQSLKVMKAVQEKLSIVDGFDYVIFPEGTRNKNKDKTPVEFHHGSFRPGHKSGADILNFCLYGTNRVLDKHVNMKKFPVELKYISKYTKEDYEKYSTAQLAIMSHDEITKEYKVLQECDEKILKELN